MANPKNRATVEEALKRELERDRTKTYVVEISPLGLVEMTRQNVTEGPREILTRRCPTCDGNGTIISEASTVVDTERRLRALAAQSPRTKAFSVELNARVRDLLVGPGAAQLQAIEDVTKRRFFLQSKADSPLDHFVVLDKGPLTRLSPKAAVEEGQELEIKLVEVGLYDAEAGVGKLDGIDIAVADAARLVGKKVRVQIVRVLDGTAFGTLAGGPERALEPITAEDLAEKPTRASRSRKRPGAPEPVAAGDVDADELEESAVDDADADDVVAVADADADAVAAPPKRKRTRRGSRGGRNRRKKPPSVNGDTESTVGESGEPGTVAEPAAVAPKIHLPAVDLGTEQSADGADGDGAAPDGGPAKRKRTRRGSRGGRRRRKPAAAAPADTQQSDH
jgi:ribonuclease G